MKKVLTQKDFLKISACITMLIDHIGYFLFPQLIVLRLIGRIAFPIYAFFIAEGFYHTRNRSKYIIRLLIFAIISQIPYLLLKIYLPLNILFTFVVSLLLIIIVNKFILSKQFILTLEGICFAIALIFVACFCDYDLLGILVVLNFYYLRKNKAWKFFLFAIITICYVLIELFNSNSFASFSAYRQLFSLVSILPLYLYNNEIKYPNKLKTIFYIFYPLHLLILALIKLFLA